MGYTRISVTVPDEILNEIKMIAEAKNRKLSHVVTDALSEKIRKSREDTFIACINKIFEDPDAAEEQKKIAEDIADNTDIRELPW